jgi:hypothetical protein
MNHLSAIVPFIVLAGALAALGCDGSVPSPALASGQRNVNALTADGDHVYWTTGDGFVRRVPSAGGTVEDIVRGVVAPTRIAVDADSVYWAANRGEISRAPKSGGTVDLLVQNEDGLGDLQVGDGVYWLRAQGEGFASGDVRRALKVPSATAETLLSDVLYPGALALAGTTLYYPALGTMMVGDGSGVRQIPADVPTTGTKPAVDFDGVFYTLSTHGSSVCGSGIDPTALAMDPKTSFQAVTCAALDGSGQRVVASGLTSAVVSVVLDDTYVYFATADGAVSVIGLDGSAPPVPSGAVTSSDGTNGVVTTSDGTPVPAAQPGGPTIIAMGPPGGISLALDATSVYWAHVAGDAVFAMLKF